nr:acyl-CoA dehydrogenase family protein [Candidatus Sigynarchaeota archaeon]
MVLENDIFLDDVHLKLRDEVKDFVKWVDPKLLRAMDAEEVDYPHDFYREAGRRNLLGLRFPKKY